MRNTIFLLVNNDIDIDVHPERDAVTVRAPDFNLHMNTASANKLSSALHAHLLDAGVLEVSFDAKKEGEFEVGDVVHLLANNHLGMVVEWVEQSDVTRVRCLWFAKGVLQRETFDAALLRHVR